MSTVEQKVRTVWDLVDFNDGPYAAVVYRHDPMTIETIHGLGSGVNEDSAWSAALAFTEQRLEEVRQLREEITMLCGKILLEDHDIAIAKRIIDRERAILAEKVTGMRPEAWQ